MMTAGGGARTRLGRPDLQPLVEELARRLEDGQVPASVSLRGFPTPCLQALADLLGSDRIPMANSRLAMGRLLDALDLATPDELRDAVEALHGPLSERRSERRAESARREALWSWLDQQAAGVRLGPDPSRMATWAETQRTRGARGGVDTHRRRLEHALAVVRSLPADGIPLSALAADRAGGPHALDNRRTLAGIVLDAVATALGRPRPTDAEEARLLWEAVGVAPDPLSSTVTVLGLPGRTGTPLEMWLEEAAHASEPVVLSLANLRRWPLAPLPPWAPAYVVENPAIVAEAASRGWSGPPLVCSSGRPSVAVVTLLRQLGAGGAPLYQHADFDPVGLAITQWLHERTGTTPWRMNAVDYLGAVRARHHQSPLTDPIPTTPWDPGLQEALSRHSLAVYEEDVRGELLAAMTQALG